MLSKNFLPVPLTTNRSRKAVSGHKGTTYFQWCKTLLEGVQDGGIVGGALPITRNKKKGIAN